MKMRVKMVCVAAIAVTVCSSMFAEDFTVRRSGDITRSGEIVNSSGNVVGVIVRGLFGNQVIRTRGEGASILFTDKEISSRFDEALWIEAASTRDVGMMAQSAWSLKGIETMLGKTDKETTSEKMFAMAAEIAVAQKNEAALKEIIALNPACKKYAEEMKLSGATRGLGRSLANMPELVTFPSNPRDAGANPSENIMKKIGGLKQYQVPVFTPDILNSQFRGTPDVISDNISTLVNRGRITLNPKMIALGALELADLKAEGQVNRVFDPKAILQEAAELAFQLNDNEALAFVVQIYQAGKLKDPEMAKNYLEQMKLMSGTRGDDSSPVILEILRRALMKLMIPKYNAWSDTYN